MSSWTYPITFYFSIHNRMLLYQHISVDVASCTSTPQQESTLVVCQTKWRVFSTWQVKPLSATESAVFHISTSLKVLGLRQICCYYDKYVCLKRFYSDFITYIPRDIHQQLISIVWLIKSIQQHVITCLWHKTIRRDIMIPDLQFAKEIWCGWPSVYPRFWYKLHPSHCILWMSQQ